MRRFTYSPQITAFVNITEPTNPNYGKTIDISEDIIEGSVSLRLNGLSSATLKLQNKNGKYLGGYKNNSNDTTSGYIFTPQDRIVIAMSRIGDPFQIFTGYLNKVPAFQLYPDAVTIEASCTLKRLWYTYFDPGLPAMIQYFAKFGYAYDPNTGIVSDPLARFGNWGIYGGISDLVSSILQDIGSWDPNTIRIDGLPQTFIDAIENASGNFGISNGFAQGSTPQITTGTESSSSTQTNTNASTVIFELVKRGLTVEDAAAFAGNFNNESGFVTNKTQGGKLSDTITPGLGYGLAQWTYNKRQQGLVALAQKMAKPIYDLGVQLDFVMQEIQPKILGYLNQNTNQNEDAVRSKTKIIFDNYETPQVAVDWLQNHKNYDAYIKELSSRQDAAVRFYQAYGADPNSFANKIVENTPISFTVISPLSGSIFSRSTDGAPGQGTHSANDWESRNAYDFLATENELLYCPVDGVVENIHGSNTLEHVGVKNIYGQQLSIKTNIPVPDGTPSKDASSISASNDTQHIFLTHFGYPTVKIGDKVSAGQVLGKMIKAGGLPCHLHFAVKYGDPKDFLRGSMNATGETTFDKASAGIVGISTTNPSVVGANNGDLANGYVTQQLASTDSTLSYLLTGDHALANDIPLIEWIQNFIQGAGRVFCSAPNGDFFAFFPDYFGWFNSTPYFRIDPIELVDLDIQLSDQNLVTHVYGVGPLIGYTQITPIDYATSAIASVQESAFNAFIKTNPTITPGPQGAIPDFSNFASPDFDPVKFLARYGARPSVKQLTNIRNPALLWMATWMEFMKDWAQRYQATAQITFMPELFPGGRVNIADRVDMFIEAVTHNISYTNGFSTSVELSAATVEGTTLEGESQRTQQSGTQLGN